jgi:hypothetical protein
MPKYGHNQRSTRASASVAKGETDSCSRFWLRLAFHSAIAQVIHGVGGSMCASAVGAPRSAARPSTGAASSASVRASPTPSSGRSSGSAWTG